MEQKYIVQLIKENGEMHVVKSASSDEVKDLKRTLFDPSSIQWWCINEDVKFNSADDSGECYFLPKFCCITWMKEGN